MSAAGFTCSAPRARAGRETIEQALAPRRLLTGPARVVPIGLDDLFTLFIEMDESGRKARHTT